MFLDSALPQRRRRPSLGGKASKRARSRDLVPGKASRATILQHPIGRRPEPFKDGGVGHAAVPTEGLQAVATARLGRPLSRLVMRRLPSGPRGWPKASAARLLIC
jgi:hypothetical protein